MLIAAVYLWVTQPAAVPTPAYKTNQDTMDNQKSAQQRQYSNEQTVAKVSRLLTIPSDTPQIYTVNDALIFRAQNPAYQAAEQGDRVLVWQNQTVVYSPSKDRIIAVVNTNFTMPESMEEGDMIEDHTEVANVEIRNGSGVAGAAARMRNALRAEGVDVLLIGDAAIRRTGTIVVDLSDGSAPDTLSAAVNLSNGTVAPLPLGEPASDASILIIIGQ